MFAVVQSVADLRHSISYTTLELEQTRLAVQEELKKRDDQLVHLKDLLSKVIRERDVAQEKYQRLVCEKILLQQQQQHQQQQLQQQQQAAAPLSGIPLPKQEIESYDIGCGIKYPIPPNSENVQAKLEVKTKSEVAVCNLKSCFIIFVGLSLLLYGTYLLLQEQGTCLPIVNHKKLSTSHQ